MINYTKNGIYRFLNQCDDAGIKEDPYILIIEMYFDKKMSCTEIAEWFKEKHNVTVSSKYVAEKAKVGGNLRSYSERRINATKRGRMVYKKKSPEELYIAKHVQFATRTAVLERDNHKCQICHNGPHTNYSIEIHHKNPESNDIEALQTLCWLCHRGLHETGKLRLANKS